MKSMKTMLRISMLASTLALLALTPLGGSLTAASAKGTNVFEYKFKVTNSTDTPIVKVLASPDGKSWGFFKLGGQIKPGESIVLVWDAATDESDCEWLFSAELEDGRRTKPKAFDFCGENVEIEISED